VLLSPFKWTHLTGADAVKLANRCRPVTAGKNRERFGVHACPGPDFISPKKNARTGQRKAGRQLPVLGSQFVPQGTRREDFMRSVARKFTVTLGAALLGTALIPAVFAAKAESFTGTVSDAMCGAKHMMEGDPAACLRTCVQKGSKYALVVGEKVYTLDTKDKATLDKLEQLGAGKATVKGEANGDTIEVSSVAAAK
jgi:hypothetical protein